MQSELFDLSQKVSQSTITHLLSTMSKLEQQKIIPQLDKQLKYIKIKSVPESYSKLNSLAYLKRYYRKHKQFSKKWSEIKRNSNHCIETMKELYGKLLTLTAKQGQALLDQLDETKDDFLNVHNQELEMVDFSLNIQGLFVEPIPKQDILQFVNVSKDEKSQQLIREAPNLIDYETFAHLVFVEFIEEQDDAMFFDFFFNDIMTAREENPELKKKLDDKMDEVFGVFPRFKATFNEYGEVESMEQVFSKPKLSLV